MTVQEDDTHGECIEPYRECMRSREDRVRQVVDANPGASNRKVAEIAGVSYQAVNNYKKKMDNPLSTKNGVKSDDPDTEATGQDNVVPLRRRRPDWKPRKPSRREVRKWFTQYLEWTKAEQKTARMMIFNAEGRLPDAAYYTDNNEPGPSDGHGALGA